jgi:DNA-binding NarL/FixJ family response regulator
VTRVLVVDDHPMFREGLRFVLDREPGIECVGEASDGREALALVRDLRPHVVLMDIAMPGLDGLEATRELTRQGLPARVLMLSMSDDDANVLAAMQAGACGYLLKGAGPEELAGAVAAAAQGNAVFGAALAGRMLALFRAAPGRALGERFPELSARELEVLEHLADGLTNQQIADRLVISRVTVRNHVSSILAKLQVADRRQAMLRAREQD